MYCNPVGPGDHNLPAYSATDAVSDSGKRNAPRFSMQSRNNLPYFPQYAVVFKGKDSPGMNVYNPNDNLTK